MTDDREQDLEQQDQDERAEEGTGARGGSDSPSADRLPAAPSDDDTPLGDTDQHSDVPSDGNA